jgi:predicted NUDIX family phosphoesterase
MSEVEHVLCVPTLLFREMGYFEGFQPMAERYLTTLLDPAHTLFLPRNEVEEDPSYKQLIPYCIFRCGTEIFHYRRGKAGGEGRLHSKRSLGIGGHISSTDRVHGDRRYFEAMHREIEEEVYLDSGYRDACIGLINDDQTAVGQVHLGIVHIFELDTPQVRAREAAIADAGFATAADLHRDHDQFETWSQIVIQHVLSTTR